MKHIILGIIFSSQIVLAQQTSDIKVKAGSSKACIKSDLDEANEIIKAAETKTYIIETPGEDIDLWKKNWRKIKVGDKVSTIFQKMGGPSEIEDGDRNDSDVYSIAAFLLKGSLVPKDGVWIYSDDSDDSKIHLIWEKGEVKKIEQINNDRPGKKRPDFIEIPGVKIQRWSKNWRQINEGDDYVRVMQKMGGLLNSGELEFETLNGKIVLGDGIWRFEDFENKVNFRIEVTFTKGKVSEVQYLPKRVADPAEAKQQKARPLD
jgi:hypothetical protein